MKRAKRILIGVGCVALLLVSWVIAITAKSDVEKQAELMEQAAAYTQDDIYILAVPLLEEAVEYKTDRTVEAENALKNVYAHLLNQRGYSRKYTSLLEKQMSREDAIPEYFEEAALFYLGRSKLADALNVLRDGVEKTQDSHLNEMYEENRYAYSMGIDYYHDVTSTFNGAIQVEIDGLWGLASATGSQVIPCDYERISTYSNGKAIVQKEGVISAVDDKNNRVPYCTRLLHPLGIIPVTGLPCRWRMVGSFLQGASLQEHRHLRSLGCTQVGMRQQSKMTSGDSSIRTGANGLLNPNMM